MHQKRLTFSTVSLDRSFPLSCRRHDSHSDCDLHSHEFHELVLILSGRGRHVTAEGEYEIAGGDVFLIRGAMVHGYAHSERVALVNILFDPRLLRLPLGYLEDEPGYHALFRVEPRLRRHAQFRPRLRLSTDDLAEAASHVACMDHELEKKPAGYRFAACTHLMRLITFLSRCYFRTPAPDAAGEPLRKISEVLSYVNRHYREAITVAELTRVAGMSESTLTRTFRRIMGHSPMDHVIRVRIAKARELLRRPGVRVTEAAFDCGFSDSNYFARQFRKVTGLAPRDYHRQFAAKLAERS